MRAPTLILFLGSFLVNPVVGAADRPRRLDRPSHGRARGGARNLHQCITPAVEVQPGGGGGMSGSVPHVLSATMRTVAGAPGRLPPNPPGTKASGLNLDKTLA